MAKKESAILPPEKLGTSAASIMKAVERSATDGKGPSPKKIDNCPNKSESDWEWDGTVDEEAHLGWE